MRKLKTAASDKLVIKPLVEGESLCMHSLDWTGPLELENDHKNAIFVQLIKIGQQGY